MEKEVSNKNEFDSELQSKFTFKKGKRFRMTDAKTSQMHNVNIKNNALPFKNIQYGPLNLNEIKSSLLNSKEIKRLKAGTDYASNPCCCKCDSTTRKFGIGNEQSPISSSSPSYSEYVEKNVPGEALPIVNGVCPRRSRSMPPQVNVPNYCPSRRSKKLKDLLRKVGKYYRDYKNLSPRRSRSPSRRSRSPSRRSRSPTAQAYPNAGGDQYSPSYSEYFGQNVPGEASPIVSKVCPRRSRTIPPQVNIPDYYSGETSSPSRRIKNILQDLVRKLGRYYRDYKNLCPRSRSPSRRSRSPTIQAYPNTGGEQYSPSYSEYFGQNVPGEASPIVSRVCPRRSRSMPPQVNVPDYYPGETSSPSRRNKNILEDLVRTLCRYYRHYKNLCRDVTFSSFDENPLHKVIEALCSYYAIYSRNRYSHYEADSLPSTVSINVDVIQHTTSNILIETPQVPQQEVRRRWLKTPQQQFSVYPPKSYKKPACPV